jgi:ubiquinone/menaquinone biosynthesis C-methylase UbiE
MITELIKTVKNENNYKSFLDVGVGYGAIIHQLFKDGVVFEKIGGIDISPPTVREAIRCVGHLGVKIMVGDILDIKFQDKAYDLCFTHGVLIHVPPKHVKRAILELVRVGKKAIVIESSVKQTKVGKMRYYPKSYWTKRFYRLSPSKIDDETVYYFAHDYEALFNRLGIEHKLLHVFDEKTKTNGYLIWKNPK